MNKLILCSLMLLFSFTTASSAHAGTKHFKIKKGNHYSGLHIGWLLSKKLNFDAAFDSSAKYETADPAHQADINKLYGFKDCGSFSHHINSARFGWVWNPAADRVDIYAYTYAKRERSSQLIGSARNDGVMQNYKISIERDQYKFEFEGNTVMMPRGCKKNWPGKLRLNPYFGGTETAPHDITIRIQNN